MFRAHWFLVNLVTSVFAVSRPPGIFLQPDNDVFFKAGETVQMPCVALGEPQPEYRWKRNEIEFNPSGNDARVVQLPGKGTLVINSPEDKDEGIFQCFAINSFGISASIKCNLRQAKLMDFAYAPPLYYTPRVGEPFTLPCVPPESVPPSSVFWINKLDTGGIDVYNYDSRVSMDREYRLRFTNIMRDDFKNGMPYACVAMNTFMRRNSQGPLYYITPAIATEAYTEVKYLWSDQDDRFGLRGETFSVKCIFSGNPTPDVHWERTDNKALSTRANLKSFAQELVITDLQFEDAGQYECWATNSVAATRLYRTFNIRVNSKPYFIQEPTDLEIGVGANVEFTCMAGGVPDPDIDWFIDGVALKDVKDARIQPPRFQRPIETKIYLSNVQQTDHMVIQCNASNVHGYVFADVYLNVLAEAPTILVPPEGRKVAAEGTSVNLTCRTTGKPDPTITWFKDAQQITGGRYMIAKSGDLQILAVVLADAGNFKCEARNLFNVTDAEGTLIVRRKTRIEQMPLDLEVNAGTDAKLTCSGTTDPEEVQNFRIIWNKDGKEITTNDQRMTENRQDNSLTISGTIQRDSGTYTCIATNGLDNDTASAVLTVRDRPDPPVDVYFEFCNQNATINWMPGSYNNAPVQYFVLQYNTAFNPDQWNFGLKVNSTLSRVNMTLSPYVNYTFRLIAYNKIGPSDASNPTPTVCPTKPDRPYYHPRNLRTLGHQTGKLYIEWTPIPQLHQNGPGFYYVLQILRVGAQQESEMLNIPINDWKTNHYEMSTGLIYEPYRITLKAANSVGEAAADPPTIIGYSYEGTPTITPTNLIASIIGDTFVIFTWDFDKSEIGKVNSRIRGEFRGFKIQFWEQNQRAQTVREFDIGPESKDNTTGNTFIYRVDDMLPNTNMEAQIHVKNNFYISSPSEIIRYKTLPGLPGPVEYFRVINIGDTHVNLEWGSPFENRGDLIGYDISYQLVTGLDLGEMQEREPQIEDPYMATAYLSGLRPSSKYRVYVYARTTAGRGEDFFIEIVTTAPGNPRMPRFTISNVGSNYINVSWWINAYASSGTIIFVEYRKLDGPEWIRTTDEVVNTWKNVSNLEPGTKYEIRIKATNGPIVAASAIEEVTTRGTALASALVGNIGWFIGMVLAILLLIALIILFFICYKKGFRFAQKERKAYYGGDDRDDRDDAYTDTTRVDRGSEHFGPEPTGYNNDYYDDRDYNNYEDGEGGFEKRPPSYTSDEYDRENYRPTEKEYEDYDRRPSDPEYDAQEPSKFDRHGAPKEQARYVPENDYKSYPDNQPDDYNDSYRRDESYDTRDDDSHDDYGNGRRQVHRSNNGRRDYDRDEQRRPSAPSSVASGSTKAGSSTFV
uniref:Neuroglian n=1 Tax=Arion vulgaris TaxID=1028688 RepID=A0A0B7A4I7_9EUPU